MTDATKKIKKKIRLPIIQLIIVIFLTTIDQYTKFLAIQHLKGKDPFVLIPGVLELAYLENRGAAFGVLQNQKAFFIFVAIVILAAILYILAVMPKQRRYAPLGTLLIFVASGACGNLIDRIRHEYVVDFISFVLIHFPVFNVADMYVTVSMFALIVLILFYYKEDELYFMGFSSHKYRDR